MPLIQSSPSYLPAPRGQDVQYIQPTELAPGFMDTLGAGLGQGISKGIYNYMEQNALEKVLDNLKPGGSALDQIKAIASATPEQREFLGKYGLPALQAEQEGRRQSDVAKFYAQEAGYGAPEQMPSVSTSGGVQTQGNISSPSQPSTNKFVPGGLKPQEAFQAATLSQRREKMEHANRSERRKSEEAISTPYILKSQEEAANLPQQRLALEIGEDAIINGDINTIFQWAVDSTNFEPFRSSDAAVFKAAFKDYYISNVSKITGQKNQWIEKQIAEMQPQIGRSKEANTKVMMLLKSSHAVKEKKAELDAQLSDEYRKTLGYVPANISSIVQQQLKPYAKQQEEVLSYNFRKIYEQYHPDEMNKVSKVPEGTPLTTEKFRVLLSKEKGNVERAVELAHKAGYTILDDSFYQSVGQ